MTRSGSGDEAQELVRVHAVLRREVATSPEFVARLVAHVCAHLGVTNLNEGRLAAFGILTADVPVASLQALREIEGVESLQADRIRRATA